jgi:HEAT repeat protein
MKFIRCFLLLITFAAAGGAGVSADINEPVDGKLAVTYQRVHFAQQYPPEAVEAIQTALQSADHPVVVLEKLAQDTRPEVRSLVALLLGEYGDPDGAKILWTLTRDELESVRLTAAGSLARLSHLTHIGIDTKGLEDERPAVRRLTASTLAALGGTGAEDELIAALKDDNELVRTDVVKALSHGVCGTEKSVNSLIEMLHDPSVNVRDRSAQVLGGYHDPQVLDPLINALQDPDWHVRASAADSLGGWVKSTPTLVDSLLKVLEQDDYALVRDRAADALVAAGDNEKVMAVLVKSLAATQKDVRFHAAQAIILAKANSALPMLMELWPKAKDNPEVREKIMDIFGHIGGPDQLPISI